MMWKHPLTMCVLVWAMAGAVAFAAPEAGLPVFRACVSFLNWLSSITDLSYEQVNVAIFCWLWPTLTVGLLTEVLYLRHLNGIYRRHEKYAAEALHGIYLDKRAREA